MASFQDDFVPLTPFYPCSAGMLSCGSCQRRPPLHPSSSILNLVILHPTTVSDTAYHHALFIQPTKKLQPSSASQQQKDTRLFYDGSDQSTCSCTALPSFEYPMRRRRRILAGRGWKEDVSKNSIYFSESTYPTNSANSHLLRGLHSAVQVAVADCLQREFLALGHCCLERNVA